MSETAIVNAPTPADAARKFAEEFRARQIARLEAKRRHQILPPGVCRASALGDPCERRIVYGKLFPERLPLPSAELQSIFDEGNLHEPAVIRLLDELGYRLYREQRTVYERGLRAGALSGTPEGRIAVAMTLDDGSVSTFEILAEIKSIAPYAWDRFDTAEDLRFASGVYRSWFPQVQVYLLLSALEAAVIFLKNKLTGMIKAIPITLDYEYAEAMLKKVERVNAAEAAILAGGNQSLLPSFVSDPRECRACPFFGAVCTPSLTYAAGMVVLSDEVLIEKAARHAETRDIAKEHDRLDKEIKDAIKATSADVVILGDVRADVKRYSTTKYDYPDEIKKLYARTETATRINLSRVDET